MASISSVPYALDEQIRKLIPKSKVLVVGAGGIGCEVLKNLALSGFQDIEIIDLDTIDVSNLNRQFLFRKEHVGKPKAVVARESILSYNPNIKIKAYHDSVTSQEYGINFFKRFNLVLNALDNRAARNHVNRMCLAADIPLIESGTSGYSGQVELIKKGVTQCYECQPKPPQKTFPGCTIRNTPSEPVHCIVWAKHLFNQLFGEDDPDQDVSPDAEDPEAKVDGEHSVTDTGNVKRTSTRQWAQDIDYDPAKLFNKFFKADIDYLLSMENLWKTRKPPVPLSWEEAASHEGDATKEDENNVRSTDMQVWSISKCAKVFAETISLLNTDLAKRNFLVWDKDDKAAMDFVTTCANIRSHIFSIPQKSKFATKSIAGNIIPAIATANAIIAGLVVLHAFKVLAQEYEKCPSIYLRKKSVHSKFILAADKQITRANPICYVCSPKPFVHVFVNVEVMTVKEFENELLKKHLNMVAPDAVLDGKGVVVISSEEGETEANDNKKLSQLGIVDGSILKCDDFLQNYELSVAINHYEAKEKDDPPYKIVANPEELKAKEATNVSTYDFAPPRKTLMLSREQSNYFSILKEAMPLTKSYNKSQYTQAQGILKTNNGESASTTTDEAEENGKVQTLQRMSDAHSSKCCPQLRRKQISMPLRLKPDTVQKGKILKKCAPRQLRSSYQFKTKLGVWAATKADLAELQKEFLKQENELKLKNMKETHELEIQCRLRENEERLKMLQEEHNLNMKILKIKEKLLRLTN